MYNTQNSVCFALNLSAVHVLDLRLGRREVVLFQLKFSCLRFISGELNEIIKFHLILKKFETTRVYNSPY
jgi:hypothetical protein